MLNIRIDNIPLTANAARFLSRTFKWDDWRMLTFKMEGLKSKRSFCLFLLMLMLKTHEQTQDEVETGV